MAKIFKKNDGSSVVKGKNGKITGNLPAQYKQPKSAPSLPKKAGSAKPKGKAFSDAAIGSRCRFAHYSSCYYFHSDASSRCYY